MWNRLHVVGVLLPFLCAVQTLHAEVLMSVSFPDSVSESFSCYWLEARLPFAPRTVWHIH